MDYLVLGIEAPGFEALTPRQRTLAYYLYRAAIAGDRIFTAQNHRYAEEIQDLLEAIHLASEGLDETVRSAVHDYLKYLWVNHGQYDVDNHRKLEPGSLTPSMLEIAALHALGRGADLEIPDGEGLAGKLERLRPHIFDPSVEPLRTNQEEGDDILASSAVNLYDPGITMEMLEALDPEWKRRLNVRFALAGGAVVPEVYRVGSVHGRDLETVVFFLEKAIDVAESEEQADGLRSLVEHFRTGDEEAFRRYCIQWLRSSTTVDYINGFIEQYKDPRGVIGQYEANVCFAADSRLIGRLAESALYFEKRMPWPEKYKRPACDRPVASVVHLVVGTGDGGPRSAAAYNLPNYEDICRDHGSKNVVLSNVEAARSPDIFEAILSEFYLPDYRDTLRSEHEVARRWLVYMHEVIGHGSGMMEAGIDQDARKLVGRNFSALEECRADLVALYHVFDPRLVEIGAFTAERQAAVVLAMYTSYLQGQMTRYRTLPEDTIREAHQRGAELVLQYLARGGPGGDRDFGVSIVRRDGHHFIELTDVMKARDGVAEILSRLQTIKSTADAGAAAELFDRFGTHVDPEIRAEMTERARKLRIPRSTVFVFPRLEPVIRDGTVVDATIHADEDLTTQQLRISRMRYSTAIP